LEEAIDLSGDRQILDLELLKCCEVTFDVEIKFNIRVSLLSKLMPGRTAENHGKQTSGWQCSRLRIKFVATLIGRVYHIRE
jgi:hypothetical protein